MNVKVSVQEWQYGIPLGRSIPRKCESYKMTVATVFKKALLMFDGAGFVPKQSAEELNKRESKSKAAKAYSDTCF